MSLSQIKVNNSIVTYVDNKPTTSDVLINSSGVYNTNLILSNLFQCEPYFCTGGTAYSGNFTTGIYKNNGVFIPSINWIKVTDPIGIESSESRTNIHIYVEQFCSNNPTFANLVIYDYNDNFIMSVTIVDRKIISIPVGFKCRIAVDSILDANKIKIDVKPKDLTKEVVQISNVVGELEKDYDELYNICYEIIRDGELSKNENYGTGAGYLASHTYIGYGAFGTHAIYSNIEPNTQIEIYLKNVSGNAYHFAQLDSYDNIIDGFGSNLIGEGNDGSYIFNNKNVTTKLIVSDSAASTVKVYKIKEQSIDDIVYQNTQDIKELQNNTYNNPLKGLNFGVDGDSITSGQQWSYIVFQNLNMNTHHNVAVGSARFGDRIANSTEGIKKTQNYDDPDFAGISGGWESTTDPLEIQKRCNNCSRVHIQKFISEVNSGLFPEPNVFVFAMGTNDSTIGTVDDAISKKDPDELSESIRQTMLGGARWAIQKIQTTYPNCRVFVSCPIQRADAAATKSLKNYCDQLKLLCKYMSVKCFDTYSECGITHLIENGTGPYLVDGLHPGNPGRQLMAKYLAKQLITNYY